MKPENDGMQHVYKKLPTEAQMDEMLNDMRNSDSKPIIEAPESVKKVLRRIKDEADAFNGIDLSKWDGVEIKEEG